MKIEPNDVMVLSTGRRLLAVWNVVGIGPDGTAYHGFDGELGEEGPGFTPEERQEIADEMIRRWSKWATDKF